MKALIKSKTFWFAVAKFVLGVLTLFSVSFGEMVPASVAGAILMATSLVDAYLRTLSTTEIGGITKVR